MNGVSTFTIFCYTGFIIIFSFGNIGNDQFKKLKQHSRELNIPSNLNTSLIPKTKSTFSWISDTNVYASNLWPAISTITGIIKSTLTCFHYPLEFSVSLMQIFAMNVMLYNVNNMI